MDNYSRLTSGSSASYGVATRNSNADYDDALAIYLGHIPPSYQRSTNAFIGTGSARNRESFNYRTSPLLANGNLNKITHKHHSYTYYVAPCASADADRETMRQG